MADQMQMTFGLSDAERMAHDVCAWVRGHGSDFKALMAVMHEQVDKGNPRTRRDDVISYARQMGMSVSVVDELRHDHTLYAGLTRYMVMLRPRLAKTISFRKSKLDDLDLVAIWHETVNAGTTFLARDRFEAEELVAMGDVSAA